MPSPGFARTTTSLLERAGLTVATATQLETRVARRILGGARVVRVGIGLARAPAGLGPIVVSCGLAGGLQAGMATGTVLIPHTLGLPDGTSRACDPELVGALVAAARACGKIPWEAPLLCSPVLVRGAERARWAAEGYAGVDMESARLTARHLAAVRVVLDTPERELSAAWLHPATALFHPVAWRELPWLARTAPSCARLAAEIVARAFPLRR